MLDKLDIYMPKNKVRPFLAPYTKMNQKCLIDLNVIAKTVKLLGKNIVIFDLDKGKALLDTILKT